MKNFILVIVSSVLVSACTSAPKTFEAHQPSSVITGDENDIPSFQEGLAAQDYRLLIKTSLRNLAKRCPEPVKVSPVMISTFTNETSADLDMELLRRELGDALSADGFSTVDQEARRDVASEVSYEAESAGHTDKSTALVGGRESAVRYIVRAVINSRAQTGEDNKWVRYRMSLQFVDAEKNEVAPGCVGAAEIAKHYERQRVGW